MRNKLAVFAIIGLAVAAGLSSYFGRMWVANALENGPFHIEIAAKAVPLDPENPQKTDIGELKYVAGWVLTSESDDFGGWSGLTVARDGKRLVAINDKGDWLTADFTLDSEQPFSGAMIHRFEADGSAINTKEAYDAESLLQTETGFLVGLEQEHRILEVDAPGGVSRLSPLNQMVDLSGLSSNGGIEAMALLPDGRFLLFAEKGLDQQASLPAWVVLNDRSEAFRFKPPANYSPTDAKALPSGDVALLMRHYSALDGVSIKLAVFDQKQLASPTTLVARELAHIGPTLTVDNMEGLDYIQLPDGTIRFFLMSDDNFSVRQQTLLMVFDWQP